MAATQAAIEPDTTDTPKWRFTFEEYNHLRYESRLTLLHAIKEGQVDRHPCEVCGAPNSEGHHTDYRQPLLVRWLCSVHHRNEHKGYPFSWQFLGADSGIASDAIDEDVARLLTVRELFKKGQSVEGCGSWTDYVHQHSRMSMRSIQRRLSKVRGVRSYRRQTV